MTKLNTTIKDPITEKEVDVSIHVHGHAVYVTTPMGDGDVGVTLEVHDGKMMLLMYNHDSDEPLKEHTVKPPKPTLKVSWDDDSECPLEWGRWELLHDCPTLHYGTYVENLSECVGESSPYLCHMSVVDHTLERGSASYPRPITCLLQVREGEEPPTEDEVEEFVQTFNQWVLGHVYHFQVISHDGEVLDSCGGCYCAQNIFDNLNKEWGFTLKDVESAIEETW